MIKPNGEFDLQLQNMGQMKKHYHHAPLNFTPRREGGKIDPYALVHTRPRRTSGATWLDPIRRNVLLFHMAIHVTGVEIS